MDASPSDAIDRSDAHDRATSGELAAADGPGTRDTAAHLLLRWQETGCSAAFAALVRTVAPDVTRTAVAELRRRGVRDLTAIDEVVALVLDHLRRLSASGPGERSVVKFSLQRSHPHGGRDRDAAAVYLAQLARGRTIDVVRRRRRARAVPFSQLDDGERLAVATLPCVDARLDRDDDAERLRAAARRLGPRERSLVELLLAGKSQAVIAHVLGVSAGTVSRLRQRAIESLRRLLGP